MLEEKASAGAMLPSYKHPGRTLAGRAGGRAGGRTGWLDVSPAGTPRKEGTPVDLRQLQLLSLQERRIPALGGRGLAADGHEDPRTRGVLQKGRGPGGPRLSLGLSLQGLPRACLLLTAEKQHSSSRQRGTGTF
ncbi:unnamed protein product [Lampetra planeri]